MAVDKQAVMLQLRAMGSRDPDVLRAQKVAMIRSLRVPKLIGTGLLLAGVVGALTVPGPLGGVPMLFLGAWLWRLGARNVAAVEAGYTEFVKSPTA